MIENKQKISLASSINNLYIIEDFIEKISDEFDISTTYYGNLLIAITEAVENAIVHGNKNDVNKNVELFFEYSGKNLKFIINDEGNGFDFDNIPDPTESNGISGRGIYLIKMLADNVMFLNNGRTIEIEFVIETNNQTTAFNRINALKEFSKRSVKSTSPHQKKDNNS